MSINGKIINATKWFTITQLSSKLILPISNIALARLLSPEAFGVVATITMILSFADMLADAGFSKYLIQQEFKDLEDKKNKTNVAFWTNISISIFIWLIIIIFSDPLANLVGNPGLGNVFVVAGIALQITSFSSIQQALYSRDFNYKTLFYVRIIWILVPFFVTIPLAVLGLSYWSIIIGMICTNLSNAIILTIKSKCKPAFF